MTEQRHREAPMRRKMPGGEVVWLARYTDPEGVRRYWKPEWNGGRSTFKLKRDAQSAIDEAYEHMATTPCQHDTVGGYAGVWLTRHPRSERTNEVHSSRLRALLAMPLEGRPLSAWPLGELRRRHAHDLLGQMLVDHGRVPRGANAMLSTLSAMIEDAITDDLVEVNGVKGARVKADDPRAQSRSRAPQVLTWDEMRLFARFGPTAQARVMLGVFGATGMRVGEVLGLQRGDVTDGAINIQRTAWAGKLTPGTKNHRGDDVGARVVPCPPSLASLIGELPPRIDTQLLFPNAAGHVFEHTGFYRKIWRPARKAVVDYVRKHGPEGIRAEALERIRPHDCRHSYVSLLRAEGIDDADLAEVTGHTVGVMLTTYTHALGRSNGRIAEAIG